MATRKKKSSQIDHLIKIVLLFAFGIVVIALGYKAFKSSTELRSKAASIYKGCTGTPKSNCYAGGVLIKTCLGKTESSCRTAGTCGCVPTYTYTTPTPATSIIPTPTCAVPAYNCTLGATYCGAGNYIYKCQSVYSNTCNQNVKTWVQQTTRCGISPTPTPTSIEGKRCITSAGWPGTCMHSDLSLSMKCDVQDPGIAYDRTVDACKTLPDYGCCGKSPIVGASCTTSQGWKGTCTQWGLLDCKRLDPNIFWENVAPCNALTYYGCCAIKPAVPTTTPTPPPSSGVSCKTTQGWSGTCTLMSNCNTTQPNTAWDFIVSPCQEMLGVYGCCAVKP